MIDEIIDHNIIKKNRVKIIQSNGLIIKEFDPVREWIKWLSYEPSFEKEKMMYYDRISIYDLKEKDLKFINEYNKRKKILPIIKKYSENDFTLEEGKIAYDYLTENSLSKLMMDKLTKNEVMEARKKVSIYTKMDYEKEDEMLRKLVEKYDKLSMTDSFAFRILYEDVERKSLKKLKDDIEVEGRKLDSEERKTKILSSRKVI